MTLLVRDEADLVAHNLRYHLEHGIDFVVATDHRSVDGTTDILREYERSGRLRLIHEEDEALRQSEWVTRMARLAATEHGADWVVNCDADEFFWPREGTFHEILEAVPARFGAVRGLWRHFVARPDTGEPFYERMVVRRASAREQRVPYPAQVKVVHRASPDVVVRTGAHSASGPGLELIREWYPFDVLHFPVRSREQMERKFVVTRESVLRKGKDAYVSPHVELVVGKIKTEGEDEVYRQFLVDDDATLEEGLASGTFTLDTRLRDALRGEARPAETGWSPPSAELLREIDAHQENDTAARLRTGVEAVSRRQEALEQLFAPRLRSRP